MSSTILNDRDTNQSMQNQNSNPFLTKESGNGLENSQPKSMDFHRKMMEKKLKAQEQEQEQEQGQGQGQEGDGSQPGAYVSPSDAIMSPASQKLSSFKQRQMNKQMGAPVKTRSLFQSISTREKDLGPEDSQQEGN